MHRIAALLLTCAIILISPPATPAQRRYTPISIPMRDGKALAADLYASDTTIPRPTILIQTPYNKNFYRLAAVIPPEAGGSSFPYDSTHYNYVIVDWRGFYGSKSAAAAGYDRGLDGYDAVEWIAAQRWSDGKVGTWGPSALGAIQFMTARQHPPHLVCSVPLVKDFKTKYGDFYYGGVYRTEHVQSLEALGLAQTGLILSHPTDDLTWTIVERGSDDPDSMAVPMLLISGWYDHFPDDILRAFDDLRARSAPSVRAAHRLVMGPWMHGGVGRAQQGILSYPAGAGVADSIALAFFDHYLRGIDNGYLGSPPVRYFQMGSDQWRSADDWYALCRRTDTLSLYLAPGRSLAATRPTAASADTLRYDPRSPSPTIGGSRLVPFGETVEDGPRDLRDAVESRGDVLVYSSPELDRDLEVTGGIGVAFHLSSDRTDTDIGVRLCDVYPDGRSVILTQGIRRLRFRRGFRPQDTALMIPGTIYPVTVELQNLAMTFLKGHRLRIDISSSNYPQYDLNPNTGGPLYTAGDTLAAANLIHLGGGAASRVLLPVTPSGSGLPRMISPGAGLRLDQNAPNPAAGRTTIRFAIPGTGHVRLDLHDALGRPIATLIDRTVEGGEHEAELNVEELRPGLYFYRLATSGVTLCGRMIVAR